MAIITKRNNSYRIKVSCGYDCSGKQVTQSMTWTPPAGMKPKQIEKELSRQAILFEEACMSGLVTSAVKFQTFSEQWDNKYAKPRYKKVTYDKTSHVLKQLNKEIGHLRLDKITTRSVQMLIGKFMKGDERNGYKPMSAKTVKNYISCMSSILDYAVRMGLISDNPCKRANLPSVKATEKDCYSLDEAQLFIDKLLEKAPLVYQCYFLLAIYGGFRRAELCGLTWDNVDFNNHIISVRKTLNYICGKGLALDTPKTKKSERSLKLPTELFTHLRRLQTFYKDEEARLLDAWTGNNEFIFKTATGEPLSPQAPLSWLRKFCKREGLRYVNVHSFRHLNASLLISNGVDVKTVQACLGHAQASTTMNIYAHSFMEAQARASQAVADLFSFTTEKTKNNE